MLLAHEGEDELFGMDTMVLLHIGEALAFVFLLAIIAWLLWERHRNRYRTYG